jgi:hypothetical protein
VKNLTEQERLKHLPNGCRFVVTCSFIKKTKTMTDCKKNSIKYQESLVEKGLKGKCHQNFMLGWVVSGLNYGTRKSTVPEVHVIYKKHILICKNYKQWNPCQVP